MAAWRNTGEVLYAQNAKLTLQNKLNGVYRRGALFDADMNPVSPQKIAWQPVAERVVNNPALAPGETKGRFAAGFTSAGLELLVEVEDPVHVMKADNGKVWEFDSLQFALDTKGEGFDVDRIEFAAALGEDGKPVLWKVYAPTLAGDLPARYTPAGERVRNGRCRIERKDGRTVYRIAVDASELYPFSLEQQPRVRFSLLVNNNDGKGRAAWIEWGSGIGGAKDPCRYGNLTPALPPGPLASQQQLKNKGWNKDYELEFRNENGIPSVKVGSSPLCAGVSSGWFGVVPGAVYRVRFEARGDARLQVLASGSAVKRLDLLPPTPAAGPYLRNPEFHRRTVPAVTVAENRRGMAAASGFPVSWLLLSGMRTGEHALFEVAGPDFFDVRQLPERIRQRLLIELLGIGEIEVPAGVLVPLRSDQAVTLGPDAAVHVEFAEALRHAAEHDLVHLRLERGGFAGREAAAGTAGAAQLHRFQHLVRRELRIGHDCDVAHVRTESRIHDRAAEAQRPQPRPDCGECVAERVRVFAARIHAD